MDGWFSYSVAHFIPFGRDVYLRLIERVSETVWPLQWLLLAISLAMLAAAFKGWRRTVAVLLALQWAWVGGFFLLQFYAELNWAGPWLAVGFLGQALLLSVCALGPGQEKEKKEQRPGVGPPPTQQYAGLTLAGAGLAWPLLSRLGRDSWAQSEFVGLHPDPTAVFSLGVALLVFRHWRLGLVLVVPCLWCVVSALTLQVLALPQYRYLWLVLAVVAGVLFCACWRAARGNHAGAAKL